jgi:sirohydrochlorin ferrochelatase
MDASAGSSLKNVAPAVLVLTDLAPHSAPWPLAAAQMDAVRESCARVLGFAPEVRLMPIAEVSLQADGETLVIPAALDFSLWERDLLGQRIAEERRAHPENIVYHDDVDPAHPLVVDALGFQAAQALGEIPPQKCGLILAASGHGDPGSRAQSYRLMRLLWEQMGFARAEVGFLRHVQPFLGHVLERCARETMPWVILFQGQWETEHAEYARLIVENTIVENTRRSHAEPPRFLFADPPGAHPLLTAWYAQRITRLWQERRARSAARTPSVKKASPETGCIRTFGGGLIASATNQTRLAEALCRILPQDKVDRVLVKVTWHGYATGAYTDPAALDLLLGALPARAIVLEGHTSSRNLGGAQFDWETEAKQNRAWIRQQEAEFLRRTGLQEVLARHQAEFVNVTEAFWDEDAEGDPTKFVPRFLLDFRGCPMLSFAKFKGPTRLGISNLFGLIPLPLRSAWHGPNITWFARACCEVAKTYGSLFELSGVVEALYSAVRWNRQGLYRSRWGNYDLIRDAAYITASRGLVAADILAARLQGQDVAKSAFFDVVREELGWDAEAAEAELPEEARIQFA